MKVIIFAYNRPRPLLELLRELKGYDVTVIDDGSEYDATEHMKLCHYIRTNHRGKALFWKQWQFAFDLCKQSKHDHFLFIPDDFYGLNLTEIDRLRQDEPFVFHVVNFGTKKMWTSFKPYRTEFMGHDCHRIGFVDCHYLTNRATLEALEWTQPEVHWTWFSHNDMSSGVGATQSQLLFHREIPIYQPINVLAHHGKWDSVMHPHHRKETPLVC